MKSEVGMFYRYKGQIGKYKKITELDRYPSFTNNYLRENEVILLNNAKFSYNIIDLIKSKDIILGRDGKMYQCECTATVCRCAFPNRTMRFVNEVPQGVSTVIGEYNNREV